jgi:hypothetical protein
VATGVLIVVGVLVALGLVLTARAPTWRERAVGLAATALPVLLLGGPLWLSPCGENDCGPIMPVYWVALVATLVALLLLLYGPRRSS